jgi:hypothetical protein
MFRADNLILKLVTYSQTYPQFGWKMEKPLLRQAECQLVDHDPLLEMQTILLPARLGLVRISGACDKSKL